jgi:hypothetical protein
MGNRCIRPEPEERFETLNREKPEQPIIAVDWSDENSVHHRSAMNSLHNYALGKMANLETSESSGPVSPQKNSFRKVSSTSSTSSTSTVRRCFSQNIKFATELHQTFHFDRHSAECERPSIDAPPQPPAEHRTEASPPRGAPRARTVATALFLPLPAESSSSPTTSEFTATDCAGARFGSPPLAASRAELCACAGPLRRHSAPALPYFPGPADVPPDPASFPPIE